MSPVRATSSASRPPTVRSVFSAHPGANPVGSAGSVGTGEGETVGDSLGDGEPSLGDADASAAPDTFSNGLATSVGDSLGDAFGDSLEDALAEAVVLTSIDGDAPGSVDCCCADCDWCEHPAVHATRAKVRKAAAERKLIAEVLHRS